MGWMEILGVAFALASVVLTVRQSWWCWPTGIVNSVLFAFVFWEARLYADVGLMVVYVVLSIYGWWYWTSPRDTIETPITRITAREALGLAAAWAVVFPTWGAMLRTWTDADYAYWDSCTVAMSLVAQWLLSRKILENWLVWIAADVLMIGLYWSKELYLMAGLYVVFLGLASAGLRSWWIK